MAVLSVDTPHWRNSQKDRRKFHPSFYSTDAGKGLDRVVLETLASPTSGSVLDLTSGSLGSGWLSSITVTSYSVGPGLAPTRLWTEQGLNLDLKNDPFLSL